MSRRKELEAALAKAEAELAQAVIDRAKGDSDGLVTDADLDKARAHCRHARAALAELNRSEPALAPGEETGKSVTGSAAESKSGAAARPHSAQSRGYIVRERDRARKQFRPAQAIHQLISRFPGLKPGVGYASSWRVFARQSFMLLALVVAYLQYYFFDVNLQIVRLPSITMLIFG